MVVGGETIQEILNWADSDQKLALLTAPINDNASMCNGLNFFNCIAALGHEGATHCILNWADSDQKLALLTAPINDNASMCNGLNFFCMALQGHQIKIKHVLDWINYSLHNRVNFNFLFSPINDNQFTFSCCCKKRKYRKLYKYGKDNLKPITPFSYRS